MKKHIKSDKEMYEDARYKLVEAYGDSVMDEVSDRLSIQKKDYDCELLSKIPGVKAAVCLLDGEPYCANSLEKFIQAYEDAREVKPVISWIDDEAEFMTFTKIDTTLDMVEISAQLPAAFEALAVELGVEINTGPSI